MDRAEAEEELRKTGMELGLSKGSYFSQVCAAYLLLKLNFQVDEVSRALSWQDFERLAGALFRASGFQVKENLVLTKPRAQIDVVASGNSIVLCVDCKHYRREPGPSWLHSIAEAQLRRSGLLRKKTSDSRPIASVILSLSEPEGRFVGGVAIVPIRVLRDFLASLESYLGLLELK
jgi:hypothetical protein